MKRIFPIRLLGLVLVVMVASATMLTACGGKAPVGKVSVVGSTSVSPLAQSLADEFNKTQPDLKIDIQGVGSTAGIKAISDGTTDIGMSSRELSTSEKALNLKETVIALDGIAMIVNPANSIQDIKKDDILKIYKGEIKNWKELGGADQEIIVVSREVGSGTRGAFEELLKLQKKEGDKTISLLVDNALIAEGNGAVLANVAGKANAIGYMSLGMVDETKVRKVKVDGVEASEANLKANQYTIARPFLMLTKAEPTKEAKAYLDFILSEAGQKIVAKDYISVK